MSVIENIRKRAFNPSGIKTDDSSQADENSKEVIEEVNDSILTEEQIAAIMDETDDDIDGDDEV